MLKWFDESNKRHRMQTSRWGGNRFLTWATHPGGLVGTAAQTLWGRRWGVVGGRISGPAQIASGPFCVPASRRMMINWRWLALAGTNLRSHQVSSKKEPGYFFPSSLSFFLPSLALLVLPSLEPCLCFLLSSSSFNFLHLHFSPPSCSYSPLPFLLSFFSLFYLTSPSVFPSLCRQKKMLPLYVFLQSWIRNI